MPNVKSHIAVTARSHPEKEQKTFLSVLARLGDARVIAIAAFLLGVSVMLMYRPFSQLEGGDDAIWDYISQLNSPGTGAL